ncbi:unnamed protein product, partial [Ectocarpus sp. 8 AP-2014]
RTTQRQGTWTRGAGHTHILLLATAEEAGNVWFWSGVHRCCCFRCCVQRGLFSGEGATPTSVCCKQHTARAGREQGVPYTTAAVSFRRREREERYWLGLCGSIGWLLFL